VELLISKFNVPNVVNQTESENPGVQLRTALFEESSETVIFSTIGQAGSVVKETGPIKALVSPVWQMLFT
jgi:hypothetical protein